MHVVVPVHAPPQPVNVDPVFGVAVSVTVVPVENTPVHDLVQVLMAEAGELVTSPPPVTFTVNSGGSFQLAAGV